MSWIPRVSRHQSTHFLSNISHSLLVGLLFSTLDTSIVATSLVTISHDLNDFVNAPWIVLAYLLTYMSTWLGHQCSLVCH